MILEIRENIRNIREDIRMDIRRVTKGDNKKNIREDMRMDIRGGQQVPAARWLWQMRRINVGDQIFRRTNYWISDM